MKLEDLHKHTQIIWKTRKWVVEHINLEKGLVRIYAIMGEKPLYRSGKSGGKRLHSVLTKKYCDFQEFSETTEISQQGTTIT